jgi:outer membrane lipoprotein SlyB
MKQLLMVCALLVFGTVAGCSQESSATAYKPANETPVGSTGAGLTPSNRPAASRAAAEPAADRPAASAARVPEYREVTIPAGTILPVELTTAVASDSSSVEDQVRGTLRAPITVKGIRALPAGTAVLGNVTAVERAARVKGRARVAFRFTSIDPPGDAERISIRTDTIAQTARATKKQDAAKIGGGAVGGAIVGGILGGGDGAAKGAAIGGAAGTGVVLSTRGKEVRLGPGARLSVRLAAPVTVRVPVRS